MGRFSILHQCTFKRKNNYSIVFYSIAGAFCLLQVHLFKITILQAHNIGTYLRRYFVFNVEICSKELCSELRRFLGNINNVFSISVMYSYHKHVLHGIFPYFYLHFFPKDFRNDILEFRSSTTFDRKNEKPEICKRVIQQKLLNNYSSLLNCRRAN